MSRIERAEILQVSLPPIVPRTNSIQSMTHQETPIVRLVDVDGVVGVGYCWTRGLGASAVVAMLRDHMLPRLIGRRSDAIDALWQDLFWSTHAMSIGPVTSLSLAAIDVALWDMCGKRESRSLWRMAGGVQPHLPLYAGDGGWLHLAESELVEQATEAKSRGFSGVKLKVGRPRLDEDLRRVAAVRGAVGSDVDVMVDANQGFSLAESMRRARAFESARLTWLEEPLPAEDIEGHVKLAARSDTPVAVGESLYHPSQFRDYFARGACSVAQPDVAYVGGITPWLKVAHMAEAFNIEVCPHYLMELSVSLACGVPNGTWLEYIPQLELITESRLDVREGKAIPPDVPGTGIVWNADALTRYQVFDPISVAGS